MNDKPWQSRPRSNRNKVILAIVVIVVVLALVALAFNAEAAGRPCSKEYALWRYARAHAVKIGGYWPKEVDTAWANLYQCRKGLRER